MKNHIDINISEQTPYLAKYPDPGSHIWFFSYGSKYSWPIKVQDSF